MYEWIHVDMGKAGSVHEMIFQVAKYNGFGWFSTQQYQSIFIFTPIAFSFFVGLTYATYIQHIPTSDDDDDSNKMYNERRIFTFSSIAGKNVNNSNNNNAGKSKKK